MNKKIGMISSIINLFAVIGFALCMLIGTSFGSYLICMFIAFSFVPMICTFAIYSPMEKKAAGYTAMIFSGAYAVFVLMVYFGQVTAVRLDNLNEQASQILNYQRFGLFFSYDLLGYGLMALATLFAGFTIEPRSKADKWLKWLLLMHGIFFIGCFVIPILGLFSKSMNGAVWVGTAVLMVWCIYFIPIGILSFLHFKRNI
ncbi:hypothetical protein [Caproicibacter sp. BJN0012]|uniref:hypothetical protein n=1 Tax=Caproicibacter sp. BJN0012 TaxID=3110227 RepID=UPI002E0F6D2F